MRNGNRVTAVVYKLPDDMTSERSGEVQRLESLLNEWEKNDDGGKISS